jgi:hypothetical protein
VDNNNDRTEEDMKESIQVVVSSVSPAEIRRAINIVFLMLCLRAEDKLSSAFFIYVA